MLDDDLQHARVRLGYLEALVAAQDRRDEVMGAIGAAEDAEDAAERLVTLLGLTDKGHARAVLDMQVQRWAARERQSIKQERDNLRAQLDSIER